MSLVGTWNDQKSGDIPERWPTSPLLARRPKKAPVADATLGFDLVDHELKSVAKVEGDVSLLKSFEETGVALGVRSGEPVLKEHATKAAALLRRLDTEQAEIPVPVWHR